MTRFLSRFYHGRYKHTHTFGCNKLNWKKEQPIWKITKKLRKRSTIAIPAYEQKIPIQLFTDEYILFVFDPIPQCGTMSFIRFTTIFYSVCTFFGIFFRFFFFFYQRFCLRYASVSSFTDIESLNIVSLNKCKNRRFFFFFRTIYHQQFRVIYNRSCLSYTDTHF